MLPSAPGLYSGTNLTPVDFSTISATIRNDISFPAPGPLGNITVMGRVGCQAHARVGIISMVMSNFLIDIIFLK